MTTRMTFTTHDPACDRCRVKKIRCDRARPRCNTCKRDEIQCKFSDKELKFDQDSVEGQKDLDRRLCSMEDSLAKIIQLVKESETQTHLQLLRLENRLLHNILAIRGHPSSMAESSSPWPPEISAPAATHGSPVHKGGLVHSFPYPTAALTQHDSGQTATAPIDAAERHADTRRRSFLARHFHAPTTCAGLPMAVPPSARPKQATPHPTTQGTLADLNAMVVDSFDLPVPGVSALLNECDFSPLCKGDMDHRGAAMPSLGRENMRLASLASGPSEPGAANQNQNQMPASHLAASSTAIFHDYDFLSDQAMPRSRPTATAAGMGTWDGSSNSLESLHASTTGAGDAGGGPRYLSAGDLVSRTDAGILHVGDVPGSAISAASSGFGMSSVAREYCHCGSKHAD